ncbi:kinase-like domain-containing protein [Pseudoneurospora amorphoporcata]|uniref:EKC/KEOPS complex subunit BUD32 n=1 Tax=Pseudoneurospora amorphoporcata TaxID=241081 RepID=A0AAN6NPQ7_9PEZI|nr:kinase-like domain-containing protein [Pseudoneurospora amorphoporcata]
MSSLDTERFPYELECPSDDSDTEDPQCYRKGGFHPIVLGDRLGPGSNGRFRVVNKLGAGGYGTVWLCQDTHHKPSTVTKWRVVKVIAAEKSSPDCPDLKILSHFRDVDRSTLDAFGICLPIDYFWITGPNGRHLALVFPWHGCTMETIPDCYGFHPALIKDMTFELVESLRLLHSRGLCHGDFRPSNILLRLLPGADEMPESELCEVLSKPYKVRIIRISDDKFLDELPSAERPVNMPEYIVAPAFLPIVSGLYTRHPVLIDLGVSFPFIQPPKEGTTGIPISYAAPESVFCTFHNSRPLLGPASDIWSLACTLAHLRVSCNPFQVDQADLSSVVAQWEECLSPLPEPYRSKYREINNIETPLDEVWGDKPAGQLDPVVDPKAVYEGRAERRLAKSGTRNCLKARMMRMRHLEIFPEAAKKMLEEEKQSGTKMEQRLPFIEDMQVRNVYKEGMEVKMEKEEIELFWTLLEECWRWNPEERVSVEEVVRHPWFEEREPRKIPKPAPWRVVVRVLWSFWDHVKLFASGWIDGDKVGAGSLTVMGKLPHWVVRACKRIGRFFLALFDSFTPSALRKKLVWNPKTFPSSPPGSSTDWETW